MKPKPLASICGPLALATAMLAHPAMAQQVGPVPPIAPGNTLLTVSAEGRTTHAPELAVFSAGVTTQGTTAGEALGANSTAMARVVGALKRAGIAERDIQTSNLNVNPVYSNASRETSGEERVPRIVGYRATNMVAVRQRRLDDFGKVIDTLVGAGANEVNGPNFQLDDQDPALDEARVAAMRKARTRADLYARASGLHVVRIVSISEGGGYYQPVMAMARMVASAPPPAPPPPPMQPGELQLTANVTVLFELAP